MRVVAFTGLPGSGKSVAADVARSLGIPVVRMGDCVWDEVRALGLALTEQNVAKIASEMRTRHGPAIWAKLTLGRVRHLQPSILVVDGVRSPEEVAHFKAQLARDFTLVAIVATQEARWSRIFARKRDDETATRAAFDERDARERGFGIEKAIAMADETISNDGSPVDLEARIRALLANKRGGSA